MTSPLMPPSSGWRVTGQGAPTSDVDSTGTVTRGVTVYFQTGNGVNSSVFVPETNYTPDLVRAQIAQKAAALDTVGSLSDDGNGNPVT